ncbi:hypothetical protein N0V90_000752 [Kalmusia sp. IMI 367209]|nr:hypothetical protein N0V90_000752 [Kalmusia sp. IMI 367209]
MAQYKPVIQPFRSRPAEYLYPQRSNFRGIWFQDGVPISVKRKDKKYAIVWPKDGKNGNKWGRFKDVVSGKGPDMFVTVGAHEMDYMCHRPRKPRWAGHTDLDDRGPDCFVGNVPGVESREQRDRAYDFQSRKYHYRFPGMWTDALWAGSPNSKEIIPDSFKDWTGQWWNRQ